MERISLENGTFEGANNVYLFDEGPETVLVDTGDGLAETRRELEGALGDRGLSFADVDRVFITHWHGDHRGLAGPIQAASGAAVYVHEADAPLIAGEDDAWAAIQDRYETLLEEWQVPTAALEELHSALKLTEWREGAPEVTPIQDGDTFTVNDCTLTAVLTPGHSTGHCMYELGEGDGTPTGEVLTGDALLPKYTPNVGGADVRVERPLERYLETLRAIDGANYRLAWPGHREPIEDPSGRAREIIDHHAERAWRVLDVLDRLGPCDTWTVSDALFGDLESIHILHGPGEAHAHLDHLERAGAVVREGPEYRLTTETRSQLEALEEERWPLE